jgi:hypothetical protein
MVIQRYLRLTQYDFRPLADTRNMKPRNLMSQIRVSPVAGGIAESTNRLLILGFNTPGMTASN